MTSKINDSFPDKNLQPLFVIAMIRGKVSSSHCIKTHPVVIHSLI